MSIVKGSPYYLTIEAYNTETELPASESLASGLEIILYTDTSKNIASHEDEGVNIEKSSEGVFDITLSAAVTALLTEGETAWIDGVILPDREPFCVELGEVSTNRAND